MTQPVKDPRIYFAVQRTLLAWIHTGLAMMGFGFVVARFGLFLRELGTAATNIPVKSTGFSLWTGTALVLAGVVVNSVSTAQYLRAIRDLNEGRDVTGRPSTRYYAISFPLHRWNSDGGLSRDSIVGLD
jgi:putative membrane protein